MRTYTKIKTIEREKHVYDKQVLLKTYLIAKLYLCIHAWSMIRLLRQCVMFIGITVADKLDISLPTIKFESSGIT